MASLPFGNAARAIRMASAGIYRDPFGLTDNPHPPHTTTSAVTITS
jgi:hypothetical protein